MLDKNGNRMLAYVQEVSEIEDIEGADNIQLAHVLGWTLIVLKNEFKVGDKCAFFEIDSKVPAGTFFREDGTDVFDFLERKHYNVKTYKLNKFGVISQGLILPLKSFKLDDTLEVGTDLTEKLGVVYSIVESGKSRGKQSKEQKIKNYLAKHKRFFNNPFIKLLMKNNRIKNFLLRGAFSKKAEKATKFPTQYISKSDEERVQNMPWVLKDDKNTYTATEKIDGTSTTYLLVRKPFRKFEFYVCSRNLRVTEDDNRIYNGNDNIYWENAKNYNILAVLKHILKNDDSLKWVCIQGESYGEGWQDNRLKLAGHYFAAFNLIDSNRGRWDSVSAKKFLNDRGYNVPWVPIIATGVKLTDFENVKAILEYSNGQSLVNKECLREGIVFRSEKNDPISFKVVSPEYLMKHKI